MKDLIVTGFICLAAFAGSEVKASSTVLGAAVGAGVGSAIGRNSNGRDGAILGAVIGGAIGAAVGNDLEHTPSGPPAHDVYLDDGDHHRHYEARYEVPHEPVHYHYNYYSYHPSYRKYKKWKKWDNHHDKSPKFRFHGRG